MDEYEQLMKQVAREKAAPKVSMRTPLEGIAPIEGQHSLKEQSLIGKINLRGNLDNTAFIEGVQAVLRAGLPAKPNNITPFLGGLIFWLGPDEWLIHCPLKDLVERLDTLRVALESTHAAVTDVTDYYTIIEVSSPQAREILASGSPFDTRAVSFKAGQCAQTRLGHASVLLWPINDQPTFGLQVRWSFAQYVFDYLKQSTTNVMAMNAFDGG